MRITPGARLNRKSLKSRYLASIFPMMMFGGSPGRACTLISVFTNDTTFPGRCATFSSHRAQIQRSGEMVNMSDRCCSTSKQDLRTSNRALGDTAHKSVKLVQISPHHGELMQGVAGKNKALPIMVAVPPTLEKIASEIRYGTGSMLTSLHSLQVTGAITAQTSKVSGSKLMSSHILQLSDETTLRRCTSEINGKLEHEEFLE